MPLDLIHSFLDNVKQQAIQASHSFLTVENTNTAIIASGNAITDMNRTMCNCGMSESIVRILDSPKQRQQPRSKRIISKGHNHLPIVFRNEVGNTTITVDQLIGILQTNSHRDNKIIFVNQKDISELLACKTIFHIHNNPCAIVNINGAIPIDRLCSDLPDFSHIEVVGDAPVQSGGHHGYRGIPLTLQAGATTSRVCY